MILSTTGKLIKSIPAMIITIAFVGCASTEKHKEMDTGKLLKASGFRKAVADTPEKLDQLKKLPQRKITAHRDGDKVFYIYADARKCQCAFSGDEEAYKKYQQLAGKKQVSEAERQYVDRDRQRQTDWDDWNFNQAW